MNWLIAAVVGVLVLVGFCQRSARGPAPPTKRLLNITAQKGLMGASITNREAGPISDCELYVSDPEGVRWTVERMAPIQPLETAWFDWSSFKAQGQPMPGHYGRDRGVYVSCTVNGLNETFSAAFR